MESFMESKSHTFDTFPNFQPRFLEGRLQHVHFAVPPSRLAILVPWSTEVAPQKSP